MRKRSLTLMLVGGLAALLLAVPGAAVAHDENESSDDSPQTKTTVNKDEAEHAAQKERLTAQQERRLDDVKLRVCRQHEAKISTLIVASSSRAQKQIDLFSNIAARVKNFYVTKGKTVANYDQLVAAVDAAKTKADADLITLKQTNTFSCDGNDPKGRVEAFQTALAQMRQDLKDYRTAVKNLIVGVRSAQGAKDED